jgi:hypothetical protein
MKSGEEMFREVLDKTVQTTKDSGRIINQSIKDAMKDAIEKVNKLQTTSINPPIKVKYKNWKGEVGIRTIIPKLVYYGRTDYHPQNQWLLDVWDVDKNAPRTYALMDIIEFIKE